MTREIKLRAWDNSLKKIRTSGISINKGVISSEDKDIILMQFTGLKDKNGKEIYEGDILKVYSNYMEKPEIYLVKWFGDKDYPAFDLENWESESNGLSELSQSGEYDYEVIGNIFENTDLIK